MIFIVIHSSPLLQGDGGGDSVPEQLPAPPQDLHPGDGPPRLIPKGARQLKNIPLVVPLGPGKGGVRGVLGQLTKKGLFGHYFRLQFNVMS